MDPWGSINENAQCVFWMVTVAILELRNTHQLFSSFTPLISHLCSPFAWRLHLFPLLRSALSVSLSALPSLWEINPKNREIITNPYPWEINPKNTEKSLPKTQTTIQNYRNQIAQTHGQTTINTQKDRKKEEEEEDKERSNPQCWVRIRFRIQWLQGREASQCSVQVREQFASYKSRSGSV